MNEFEMLSLPSLEEINRAEILLKERKISSPIIQSNPHSNLFLKLDSNFPGGSYKIRGVEFYTTNLSSDNSTVQVLSAGNLAIATAMRLKEDNVHTIAIVPEGISKVKYQRLKDVGASIHEKSFAQIWDLVLDTELRKSQIFLHPFNKFLLAGYATIISELKQIGFEKGNIVLPYGLGGLACAIAHAIEKLEVDIKLYICEIVGFAPFSRALQAYPTEGSLLKSFIEAMGMPIVITDVFNYLKDRIAGVVLVTESDVKHEINSAFHDYGLKIEGAAGASLAAAKKLISSEEVIAIMTGSNISDEIFDSITLRSHLF